MTAEELLLGLKDIQPPAEPAWWLIAPSQMLAIGLIATLMTCAWFVFRYKKANRLALLAELDLKRVESAFENSNDTRQLATDLSKWLKQVSIIAFPERQAQGLTGTGWLQFLDQTLGDNRFSGGTGKLFGDMVYSENPDPDSTHLIELCQHWLIAVKPRLLQRGKT